MNNYGRSLREQPETITAWLEKWEPKIKVMRARKRRGRSERAGSALDELEFLLARTVENQVAE